MSDVRSYDIDNRNDWCPGCGNFGMLKAMKRALAELDLSQERFVIVWGIGQHGNGADFIKVQGMHALHGRALPTATGIALTRPDLRVIVQSGDGDGYGLGMGHFIHGMRRNLDIAYIAHNNQIYGLTTGQASPTSMQGMKSPSTPHGQIETPVNSVGLAIAQGATFVARGFAGDVGHMTSLFKQAIEHKGFALVDVFQPCVTFNKINTFEWFDQRVYKLEEAGHDTSDKDAAFDLSLSTFAELTCTPETCRVPIGVYYKEEGRPTYQQELPQLTQPLWKLAEKPRDISKLLEDFT